MLPALAFPEKVVRRLGHRYACTLLSALFVLGSAFPQFQALLPHDPVVAFAAGRVHSQPVMWFPLAYTLTGLPEIGWTPGQGPQLHGREPDGGQAYVTPLQWNEPALPVAVIPWFAPALQAAWLRLVKSRRPRAPDLSTLDPPPRPCLASR